MNCVLYFSNFLCTFVIYCVTVTEILSLIPTFVFVYFFVCASTAATS